jgi:DNA polymerase-4
MNSFFASVEQAANPFLRGKPVIVGGGISKRSVVAAASYEAKAKGVKNGMSAWDAKKICPDAIIVVGDMPKYISTSKAIMKYLSNYTDLVEVFSIDEAWLDVTDTKKRWETGDERCGEIVIAQRIKKWIRERFHLTCNIGISYNKLMAKFAGELKKPDAMIILRPEDIPDKIKDVPVSKLCGVGRKIEGYLAEMGVRTFGELNRYPREKLVKRFGMVYGEHLWHMGQGIDNSPVLPCWHEVDAKSIGHSYTLPKATRDVGEVKSYLLRLSESTGRRMRHGGYAGNIVHLSIGFGDFRFWGKQKKIHDHINDGYDIYNVGEAMFDEHMKNARDPFRFVGITVSGLVHNIDQISIFEAKENRKKALKAVDEINDRYGEFTVERALIMNTVLQKKTGMVTSGLYKRF